MATVINIGNDAVTRSSSFANYTIVDKKNPANESGKITSIEIYAHANMSDCEVAIFYIESGTNLTTRDNCIIGSVTAGSKQTFTKDSSNNNISLTAVKGDFIGIWFTAGSIKMDTGGGIGFYYKAGDNIPCENTTFSYMANWTISLHGIGTTAVGWAHKWNGVTIGKLNGAVISKWNGIA